MKKIISLCFIMLLFSFSLFFIVQNNDDVIYEDNFDICEDGLVFVKLGVSPQFDSIAQKDFYLDQYKYEAQRCE